MSKFLLAVALCALFLCGLCQGNEGAKEAVNAATGGASEGKDAASSNTTPEEKDIYDKAASCPHRFHMGCLLDVLEKGCNGLQALEACANTGKCKNLGELESLPAALDPTNIEAVDKCCCSKAYSEGGYEDCKTPDPVCKQALDDHLKKGLKENVKLLEDCLKQKKQAVCKKAVAAANWVREAVQKARGVMWSADGCQVLAPPEPISKCGFHVKPEPRAIERADLYCDTIIWQFKEMGASDPFMEKCKDAPKLPKQSEQPAEGGTEEGDFDDEGGEEPETMKEEAEGEEEEEGPDSDGSDKDTDDAGEDGAQSEGDGSDEEADAEEPENVKDEL